MSTTATLAVAEAVGPRWRAEPYRILFPLGGLLAWAGVLHWLLLATGATDEYRSTFHAITQIQGLMTCFATGFLFTFIPRRTGGEPARAWQIAVAVVAPVATTGFAWFELWVPSQACWVALILVVMGFAFSRARRSKSRGAFPPGFLWVPGTLAGSLAAAVVAGIGGASGGDRMWLHDVGRSFIQQGLFTGLVLGIGSLLLPVLAYGKPPAPPRRGVAVAAHAAAILAFMASFPVEWQLDLRAGFAMRAAITTGVLCAAGLWRRPTMPGLHRTLAWLSAWCLPMSALVVTAFPGYRRAGLHVAFIGCFALAALSVSVHVALTHAGRAKLLEQRPWQVAGFALLLAAALGFRFALDLDPVHFNRWLGCAAACFLSATVVWALLVVPRLTEGPPPPRDYGARSASSSGPMPVTEMSRRWSLTV